MTAGAEARAFGPLVEAGWLHAHVDEPDVRVVDCRWRLGDPGWGEAEYLAGHVPGAAFLDLERDLAAPAGARGRHPVPDAADFERAARRAGISRGSRVVAVDEAAEGGAARLWWLLRHFGHDAAAVLDGGMRAWRAAGLPLAAGAQRVPAGDVAARPRERDVATPAELRGRLSDPDLVLLDARVPERFRGVTEPIDPVAGHIPGARNLPFSELAPGGRFLAPEELRRRLERAGVRAGRDTVAYCGSGVSACVAVLAAAAAGFDRVRLYPGSWSEWSLGGGPIETGGATSPRRGAAAT